MSFLTMGLQICCGVCESGNDNRIISRSTLWFVIPRVNPLYTKIVLVYTHIDPVTTHLFPPLDVFFSPVHGHASLVFIYVIVVVFFVDALNQDTHIHTSFYYTLIFK